MSREEAIRRLTNIERHIAIHTEQDKRDFSALEMAISALEEKPCIYDLKNRYCPKLDEHGMLKHQEQENYADMYCGAKMEGSDKE